VGSVAELPGCHTQARFLDELGKRIREATPVYLGNRKSAAGEIAFVGVQTVEV
jgi:predicted RNase H-like HicB family nuclease